MKHKGKKPYTRGNGREIVIVKIPNSTKPSYNAQNWRSLIYMAGTE